MDYRPPNALNEGYMNKGKSPRSLYLGPNKGGKSSKKYEPEDKPPPSKSESDKIRLAGPDWRNQCEYKEGGVQCGRKKEPGSQYCDLPNHTDSQK